MVSLRGSLINIWSLLNGQVVSNTSCLRLTDYFRVAVCELVWNHHSVLFKPTLDRCFFYSTLCSYNMILIKDTTRGLVVPHNQIMGDNMGCSPSVISIISHETKGVNIDTCAGPITEWWLLISYSIPHYKNNICFTDQPIHAGTHVVFCLVPSLAEPF